MNLQTRDESSAFAPGCDVWIVSEPESSIWTRKIDWYLNFQIMKASLHVMPSVSAQLRSISAANEFELDEGATQSRTAPLMIASSRLVPAAKTVVVRFGGDLSAWVSSCHKVWQSLQAPRTRIFLPDGVGSERFSAAWPKATSAGGSAPLPESIQLIELTNGNDLTDGH